MSTLEFILKGKRKAREIKILYVFWNLQVSVTVRLNVEMTSIYLQKMINSTLEVYNNLIFHEISINKAHGWTQLPIITSFSILEAEKLNYIWLVFVHIIILESE